MISLSTGFPSGESSEKTPDLGRRFVDRAEEAEVAGPVRPGRGGRGRGSQWSPSGGFLPFLERRWKVGSPPDSGHSIKAMAGLGGVECAPSGFAPNNPERGMHIVA